MSRWNSNGQGASLAPWLFFDYILPVGTENARNKQRANGASLAPWLFCRKCTRVLLSCVWDTKETQKLSASCSAMCVLIPVCDVEKL